ncbi:MAG TPA: hypothetical protein VH597_12555 [Verrucomicrobiae bacterium]|jgi:hypothetical protein|nr:hypothetical protein [Verrucomicrobiae bacterium]
MFNLEHEIAEWRQQMISVGIKNPAVLDELESHLREDMEHRILYGEAQDTFQKATQQIGQLERLKAEFEKTETNERKLMKRGLIIGAGVIGILVGMGFVTPAVAQYQHEGVMKNAEPWLFLLGSLLTLASFGLAIRGLKKSRA